MASLVISSQTQDSWQNVVQSLQDVLGWAATLYPLGAPSDSDIEPIRSSRFCTAEHEQQTAQFIQSLLSKQQALGKKCLQSTYPLEQAHADELTICGIWVHWPTEARYGVLMLISSQGPLPVSQQTMLEGAASLIEKDLARVYQSQRTPELDKTINLGLSSHSPIFQNFIDSFSDHIWVKNMDGVYVYCNKQAEKVWQKKQTDIIGHTDEEIFGQEIAEKYRLADQKVLAEGMQSVVEEYLNVHDLDNNSWLETIKTPLLDSSSHAVGTIGMTRNVTNRKVVEEQLMLAGTVFENSVEGVIITDKSGNIAYVNKAFCDITGYSEMEAVGRNPRFLKSGRHGEDFYQTMWQAITADGKWQGEIWNRRKDGRVYPELATISVVYNEQKEICNFVAVFADISQQKHSEAILTHMAYHDPLTDLPNRLKLVAQMDSEIQRVKRYSGQFATIFIDVDHFKHINDTYGHLVGDEVLCCVAKRLSSSVRLEDTVSRIGGDEFVVLMPALMKIESVRRVVGKLMAVFNQPVKLSNGEKIRLTGSLGIALYPGDGETSETLLKNADNAMYRAKQNRNDYAYYTESLTRESENHLKLQSAIHESLEGDGFHLVYQPQVAVSTGSLIGFEALIRWNHPIHGNITPTEFIPIAESIGLIHAVGHWVLKEACLQGVRWLKEGYDFGRISVNVAGQQLQRATFVLEVQQVLNETGLGANYLELEVTESFMMRNPEQSIKYLNALKNLGIHVAIDDFGTGYSSLSYLQKLPLDKVKLDRSFVKNIPQSSHDIAIAEAVIALGKALSLTVIAEGVETKEQVAFLQERGCGQAQGYYYGYPETPEDLISLLEKNR